MYHPVSYELIVKAEIERRSELPLYHLNPNQVLLERKPPRKLLKVVFERVSRLVKYLWVKSPSTEPEKSISTFS